MNKKIILLCLIITAVVLFLCACKNDSEQAVTKQSTASGFITDSAGRKIQISAELDRIIVLNTSTFNMIRLLGAEDKIIGVSESTQKTERAAADKEVFGLFHEPNIEKIVAARPDVVFDNSNMRPEQLKQLEDAGIKVVFLEFYLPSIMQDEIINLGKFLKKEEQAQRFAEFLAKYQNLIDTRLQSLRQEEKVTVYFEGYSDYGTVAGKTGGNEMVIRAGGINIAGKETVKYPKVSDEWVLEKNPQVIIKTVSNNRNVMGDNSSDIATVQEFYGKIISRNGWERLQAVQNRKVLLLASDIGTTPEGSIIGILYMAKMMYPDIFADIDPGEIYREMEKTFFHIEPQGIIVYP